MGAENLLTPGNIDLVAELGFGIIKGIIALREEARTASEARHQQIIDRLAALNVGLEDEIANADKARDEESKLTQDAIDAAKRLDAIKP